MNETYLYHLPGKDIFVFECSFNQKDIPKRAGFLWHGGNCWNNCKACAEGVGKKWWTYDATKAVRLMEYADEDAAKRLEKVSRSINGSKATDASIDIPVPNGLEYLPFQKAGIAYAKERKGTLIGDEMGLGKTIEALGLVNIDDAIKKVLIIVPASLRVNWLREAEKWLVRNFNFHVVESIAPIPAEADIVIVNYEKLKGEVYDSIISRNWHLLIVDESHKLKNPKAQRTKCVLGVPPRRKGDEREVGIIDFCDRYLFLTGTPILNRPIEIQSVLGALAPREFGHFFRFAKRYADAHETTWGWDFTGASHLDELQWKLRATCMVRRLKKDVLKELPAKRRQIVTLALNGAAEAVAREADTYARHEELLEALRAEVELAKSDDDEEKYKKAVAKLRESGRIAFEDISRCRHEVALAKLPAVIEHVDNILENEIDKIVIFAHHKDVIAELVGHFEEEYYEGIVAFLTGDTPIDDRQPRVDLFQNDPECKIFIGSTTAAGVGFTLTASSHVVFAELDWVPANITQAEDRLHRIGQEDSVLVQHLVVDGSLDARMAKVVIEKQEIAHEALDAEVDTNIIEQPPKPVKKYPVATDEERDAAAIVVQLLAGVCDGAWALDGAGFNKVDTRIGHEFAARSKERSLTDGEVFLVRKYFLKYWRQLPDELVEILKIKKSE